MRNKTGFHKQHRHALEQSRRKSRIWNSSGLHSKYWYIHKKANQCTSASILDFCNTQTMFLKKKGRRRFFYQPLIKMDFVTSMYNDRREKNSATRVKIRQSCTICTNVNATHVCSSNLRKDCEEKILTKSVLHKGRKVK